MKEQAPRWAYIAFGVCAGVGLALIVYRFAMQPIGWSSTAKDVCQYGAIALLVGGGQLVRTYDKRAGVKLFLPIGIAAFGVAFGLAYVLVPPPNRAPLTTKALPGFTISLPAGEEKGTQLDYMAGRYELVNVVGTGDVVLVEWEPGASATDADLQLLARGLGAAFGGAGAGTISKVAGPDGKAVPSVELTTEKGPLRVAIVACGGRKISVMVGGNYIQGLFDRIVPTLACHPDPAREKSLDEIPLAIDLPPAWQRVPGEPGQVSLTDGTNALLLKAQDSFSDDANMPMVLTKLFAATGQKVTLTAKQNGRYPLSGNLGGQNVVGFVWPFQCGTRGVLVMAFAVDQAGADALAEMIKTKSHCAGPNEVVKLPPMAK